MRRAYAISACPTRTVYHRPAPGTRLLPFSFHTSSRTPTPTTSAAQRPNALAFAAICHPPVPRMEGPRTFHGTPYPRAPAKCAPHSSGARVSPPQATPRSTAFCSLHSGLSAPLGLPALLGLPRRIPCRPVRTVGGCPTQNKHDHLRIPPSSPPAELRSTNAGHGSPLPSPR